MTDRAQWTVMDGGGDCPVVMSVASPIMGGSCLTREAGPSRPGAAIRAVDLVRLRDACATTLKDGARLG
jgi:hypothetical protein